MELTPIKVRGKRKAPASAVQENGRKSQKRGPGRPMSLPSSRSSSRMSSPANMVKRLEKAPKKRSLKNLKPQRKMSLLEKLPIELLERVYLYALNIALPRSSPIIGGKLSSEMIYIQTITAAFGCTWLGSLERDETTIDSELSLYGGFDPGIEGIQFQSVVLRCRWLSLGVLFKAKDNWIQSIAPRLVPHHLWFEDRHLKGDTNCSLWTGPSLSKHEEIYHSRSAAEHFGREYERFIRYASQDYPLPSAIMNSLDRSGDVDHRVDIPESLLTGQPFWTNEQRRFLFWIVKSGAVIQWQTSTNGESASIGLKNAISAGDIQVILLLVCAGMNQRISYDVLLHTLHNAPEDKWLKVMNHLLFNILEHPQGESINSNQWADLKDELFGLEKNGSEMVRQLARSLCESQAFIALDQVHSYDKFLKT